MSDRFYSEYQKRMILKTRAPLPPGTSVQPTKFTTSTTTLGLFLGAVEYGTVTYYTGDANSLGTPWLAAQCPHLFQPVSANIHALPRLLIITGFYSHAEHTIKGVGSAMLRELLKLAELADCSYIIVASGINHEVYTGLGFDLIDPIGETWCMPISRLRARVSPLRGAREAP